MIYSLLRFKFKAQKSRMTENKISSTQLTFRIREKNIEEQKKIIK